jgi:hypothetical protein
MNFELGKRYGKADLEAGGYDKIGLVRSGRLGEGKVCRYENFGTSEILLVRVKGRNYIPLEYYNLASGEIRRYVGGKGNEKRI